jgi:ribonuclease Z
LAFRITILGSSGALPAYGRFPSSQFIEIQNRFFLIDCGEGTQMQLMNLQLPFHKINHIFISHLHGDHYLGLTGLLFTMHLQRRTNELHIYSQRGLREILLLQLQYSKSALNYNLILHELDPGKSELIFEDDASTVTTIPMIHKVPCTGFLFREKIKQRKIIKHRLPDGIKLEHIVRLKMGEDIRDEAGNMLYKNDDFTVPSPAFSYAYCSDTVFTDTFEAQIREVDLLYHEATFMDTEADKALETKHSTAAQAAVVAKNAHVKRLLIGHFSARYRDLGGLLLEAQHIFPETSLAIEGKTEELTR